MKRARCSVAFGRYANKCQICGYSDPCFASVQSIVGKGRAPACARRPGGTLASSLGNLKKERKGERRDEPVSASPAPLGTRSTATYTSTVYPAIMRKSGR